MSELIASAEFPLYESKHPDYHRYVSLCGKIAIIDGLISSGKTTWGNSIVNYLNSIGIKSIFFTEPIDNEFLNMYISDMKKYSFTFQLDMKCERKKIYKAALDKARREGYFVIIDRGMHGDKAFALMQKHQGMISKQEWSVYLRKHTVSNMPEPEWIIMLKCSPETAMRRTELRGRDGESAYTLDYFERLENAYDEVFAAHGRRLMEFSVEADLPIVSGNIPDQDIKNLLNRMLEIHFD